MLKPSCERTSKLFCALNWAEKTRQTEKEVGRQQQEMGMERPGVRQVPEGSGERGKKKETGCEIICSTPTNIAVKE